MNRVFGLWISLNQKRSLVDLSVLWAIFYCAFKVQYIGSIRLALFKRLIWYESGRPWASFGSPGRFNRKWSKRCWMGRVKHNCRLSIELCDIWWELNFSAFCLYRIVRQSHAWRKLGRVKIGLSDRTLGPLSTRGLRNYYIVIPSHMLGQKYEMKVSLAHELQHLRQGGIEWEILLKVLKPIFFWNPAYHAWKRQVEHLPN